MGCSLGALLPGWPRHGQGTLGGLWSVPALGPHFLKSFEEPNLFEFPAACAPSVPHGCSANEGSPLAEGTAGWLSEGTPAVLQAVSHG